MAKIIDRVGNTPMRLVVMESRFMKFLRLAVFPNPVAEPVIELASRDLGVDRELSAERKLDRLRWACPLAAAQGGAGQEQCKGSEYYDGQRSRVVFHRSHHSAMRGSEETNSSMLRSGISALIRTLARRAQ